MVGVSRISEDTLNGDTPVVIMAWMPRPDSGEVNSLVYAGGLTRTYWKDRFDGRAALGAHRAPPYFRDPHEGVAYMMRNPGTRGLIQLDARAAIELGWGIGAMGEPPGAPDDPPTMGYAAAAMLEGDQ